MLLNFSHIVLLLLSVGVAKRLHPVVLVPGNGGSQVEGRLNKTEVPHYLCSKTSDWYDMWLNLELMVPEIVDCWIDNIKLKYDNVTRTTSNNDGVETRIPGFGNTSTVEYLDPSQRFFSVYFAKVVAKLIAQGYERGINLHGAPYDFRKAANELQEYFQNVKDLIEKTYANNSNTSVIILTHSMGSPMMLYFLNHQSKTWKDKYIRCLMTLAGPWDGAVSALKVFAVGDDFGAWIILNARKLTGESRTSPGLAWLMPGDNLWGDDEVLVETAATNYTVKNYKQFFTDISEPNAWLMREDTQNLISDLNPPDVEVFCLHGIGVDTTEKLVYPNGSFPGLNPTEVKGDGDGTVNMRSLLACRQWRNNQLYPVHHHEFPGTNHLGILRDEKPTSYISFLIENINDELNYNSVWNDIIPIIEIV